MKVIDLFCGAGGFSEGFKQAGFQVVLAVDLWETALKSHLLNHPECEHWLADIERLDPSRLIGFEADVIIGSPPCTNFSKLKRGADHPENLITLCRDCHLPTFGGDYSGLVGTPKPNQSTLIEFAEVDHGD